LSIAVAKSSYSEADNALTIRGVSKFYPRQARVSGETFRIWPFNRSNREGGAGSPLGIELPEGETDDEEEEEDEEVEEEFRKGSSSDVWALRNLDLTIKRGSSLALIGDNGAGKTTLLRLLARAIPPTEGTITLFGRVSPFVSLASLFVQPDLTGRENVYGFANFFEIPTEIADRQMDTIAAFAELGEQLDLRVKTYSSGMVSRLAFSSVLHLDPEILLADTAIAVGDSGFRKRCVEQIRQTVEAGATLLFATHDLDVARSLCEHAVWLDCGHLVSYGPTDEVAAAYERSHERGGTRLDASDEGTDGTDEVQRSSDENQLAALRGVGLFSLRGEPVTTVRVDEELLLEVETEVRQAGTAVRSVVVLEPGTGERIRLRQPEPFVASKPALVTSSVLLPANFLQEAAYDVRVGAQLEAGGDSSAIVRRKALRFDSFDPREQAEPDDEEESPVIAQDLRWDVGISSKRGAQA
jgi:ABC-type polysaccharide/polyol phosphate transport system ATPase subunit